MRDTICTTFVIVVFLDYLVMFGLLIHWMIQTWLPRSGRRPGSQRSHGIPNPH